MGGEEPLDAIERATECDRERLEAVTKVVYEQVDKTPEKKG